MPRLVLYFLLGLIFAVLLFGFIAYILLIRPSEHLVQEVHQIAQIEDGVKNRALPPSGMPKSPLPFLRVVREVEQELPGYSALAPQLELLAKESRGRTQVDLRQALSLFTSNQLLVQAAHLQVAALNQEHVSLSEYRWVAAWTYGALGLGYPTRPPTPRGRIRTLRMLNPPLPARFVLGKEEREELLAYYPLTWFGL
jgi:hypothetical protein